MKFRYRVIASGLVLACAAYFLAATALPGIGLPFSPHINLGLDLKGGTQLTLGVETDKAVQAALAHAGQTIREQAGQEGITVLGPRLMPGGGLELLLPDAAHLQKLTALAATRAPQAVLGEPRPEGTTLRVPLSLTPEFREQTENLAADQVLRTIASRIDQFGVAEPDIRKQAADHILIQLPGLTDVNRAVQLVGQTAQLSFHLVREDISPAGTPGVLPPGTQRLPLKNTDQGLTALVLDAAPLMRGDAVADARPGFDKDGKPLVALSFTPAGADRFAAVTGEHRGHRLAIVLDNTIHSAPVIQEKITGGSASITGHFSVEEAQDLAISLRSGSLAAPVHVLEERTVGPSLGEASITFGLLAALAGTLAVVIIMPLRYGRAGWLADGMLFCTLGLLMAGMAVFGATLTLPGIAGIALTIGMAVDANVLIFERIREELQLGLMPRRAVAAGFERASLSITDSNLTTILVAVILYQFGTGPVRGFAVTLTLGILASMFTAVVLCRLVLEAAADRHPDKPLGIYGPLRSGRGPALLERFPYLHYARHAAVSALVLLLAAFAVTSLQGGPRYGVDFSGGVAVQARFNTPVSDLAIKEALSPLNLPNVMLQQYGTGGTDWQIRFGLPDIPAQKLRGEVDHALETAFPDHAPSLDRLEMVGPKVGDDLRASALEAIYYALLLITVYISGRFEHRWGTAGLLAGVLFLTMSVLQWLAVPLEWCIAASLALTLAMCWRLRLAFAAGAMISLLFDVATTSSFILLLGEEIDLNIIAALLTIIGYSLNDTIVIFDRIRETLRRENPDSPRPIKAIIQESIAATMSRTLLTAGTTLATALALLLLGGPVIHGFALTMFIGVTMGTLSSLFMAAPVLPLFAETPAFRQAVTPVIWTAPGKDGVV